MNYFLAPIYSLSILMGLSSSSLIPIWVSVELNLIVFLGFMVISCSSLHSELIVKYFIIQITSTAIFMWMFLTNLSLYLSFEKLLLWIAISMKLGLPPFHFWFINLIQSTEWGILWLLSTAQKVLPFYLLKFLCAPFLKSTIIFLAVFVIISNVVFLSSIKLILAYSSIFSGLWIISIMENFQKMFIFLLVYALALALLTLTASSMSYPSPTLWPSPLFYQGSMLFSILFLNLAGIPPMMGFFAKMMVLIELTSTSNFILPLVLIGASVWILLMYLQMVFPFMAMRQKSTLLMNPLIDYSSYLFIMLILILFFLFII